MSKELDLVLIYARGVWHRRWLVLLVAAIVSMLGWATVFLMPDKFEVTARVYLETKSMLRPLLRGLAVESNVTEETARVLRRTLLNRPFLEKVARKTDMDLETETPRAFEIMLQELSKKLSIAQDRRQNIYTISYQNKDPQRAARVVEELLNLFVEEALGATRRDTGTTRRFLNEQISENEAKLEAAEEALKEFKRRNVGFIPGENLDYFGQLGAANERLRRAELELEERKNQRNELTKQLAEVKSTISMSSGDIDGRPRSAIGRRIRNIESRLDELVMKYTENHPDVLSTRRILSELKKQQAEQAKTEPNMDRLGENPVFQELKISLGRAEAQVAALQVRVEQYRERVSYLRRMIDTIPQVEADLSKLNRDYSVIRENYEELVKRRESAKLSYAAEKSDDIQFKVIEPPRVPLVPISPNRPLLLTGVLFAGIGLGVGLIVLMMQLKPTFDSRTVLKEATGLPVFGSVSMSLTGPQLKKERIQVVLFGIASIGLLFTFSGLQVLQYMRVDLRALFL